MVKPESEMSPKRQLGLKIAERLVSGQTIAVGTGTTVSVALEEIGRRIAQEGLVVRGLVTSYQSAEACGEAGIAVLDPLSYRGAIDWGFDGADQVDGRGRLIKGKGAALLREKILAVQCPHFIVLIDESKLCERLGAPCPVPVECVPQAVWWVTQSLQQLGAISVTVRDGLPGKHGPVLTEQGNFILDCLFDEIADDLENRLNAITGVVENGIFTRQAQEIWVAYESGVKTFNVGR